MQQSEIDLSETTTLPQDVLNASSIDTNLEATRIPIEPILPSQQNTDEAILAKLYQNKETQQLRRSYLKSLGIQHPLDSWTISIGDYQLKRANVFRFTFNLSIT